MADEIIKELWKIKDDMAREFQYDPAALVAHLRTKKRPEVERVTDSETERRTDKPPTAK